MCTILTLNICLMCHTQWLDLTNNQIGDAGLTALAKAVESGALASLKELIADEGPLGVDHPKLKAACQSRGITLR